MTRNASPLLPAAKYAAQHATHAFPAHLRADRPRGALRGRLEGAFAPPAARTGRAAQHAAQRVEQSTVAGPRRRLASREGVPFVCRLRRAFGHALRELLV